MVWRNVMLCVMCICFNNKLHLVAEDKGALEGIDRDRGLLVFFFNYSEVVFL